MLYEGKCYVSCPNQVLPSAQSGFANRNRLKFTENSKYYTLEVCVGEGKSDGDVKIAVTYARKVFIALLIYVGSYITL
eukprot:1142302-Pelagomonas_calceolata.AAC.16